MIDVGVEHKHVCNHNKDVGGARIEWKARARGDADFGRRTAGSRLVSLMSAANRRLVDQVGLLFRSMLLLVD